ncbi:uncharacterized protein BX664DRAFT_342201 [Halteromyces radiatus]|uniref:uncharacterized protein n=1 Tax=Halteromyces radiatus TaxID=101107 RepID=UPI00221FE5EA|nr:uncharacterized protein BX664DRAFT_342201 [Halteromyces radiatus]KAI8080058.1 hypothetical protein BX664DRAFT_342201 [Halteromyces radiatus]
MTNKISPEKPPVTFLDHQANTPTSIWGLSALSLATLPLSARKAPGMPSVIQSLLFTAIYGGAGYVTHVGDSENGAGIATAWCLSWSFLNAKKAILSCKPVPLLMVAATSWNILVYGNKTLKVNGYI